MKTLSPSTMFHRGHKARKPTINATSRGQRRGSSFWPALGFGAVFALIIAAVFYTDSSASSSSRNVSRGASSLSSTSSNTLTGTKANVNATFLSALLPGPQPVQSPGDESIATFAVVNDVCTSTPKSNFELGEKVCVRVENAPLRAGAPLRRINLTGPKGFVRDTVDVTTDPQENLFPLPEENTSTIDGVIIDNRGTWSVSINATSDSGTRAIAYFNVSDPDNVAADLVIYNFSTAEDVIAPGTNTGFFLWLSNDGPDAAANVHLTMAVPPNMSYIDATTSSAFTCAENDAGVVDCTLPPATNWASGAVATITLNFSVSGGAPNGIISSTANISSDTFDPRTASNSSEASVEVRSAGAPPATCALGCPPDITATADTTEGGVRGTHVTFAGSVEVSGDCGTITFSPASGDFFPEGTNAVNVTSSTGGGACSFTVTVIDTPPPTITCPANQTAQAPAGETHATVNPGTATATGTGVSVSGSRSDNDCVPQPGDTCGELSDPYPVGTTIITWTATDSDGRTASCQQTITVTSNDAFSISCPPNRSFTANDCAGYTASASDIGSPTTSGGQAPVTVVGRRSDNLHLTNDPYPVGQTIITWTATDNVGRVVSCSQTINVTTGSGGDNTPPTLTVPPDVVATTSSCTATLDDELGVATAEDNCSAVSISRTGVPTFSCPTPGNPDRQCESFVFPTGTTVITYTATDASGNSTTGTQNVTVTENPAVNPTVTAPDDSSAFADANCQAPVPDYMAGSTAADNCGSVTLSQSPAAGSLVGYGAHTVTVTATDASGNTSSDTVVFTVNDNTPPTITAPADSSAFADANCQATVPDYRPGTTAADNCGSVTLSQSPAPGTLVGYGPHDVVVTANDGHGNTASDTVVFTVIDNTAPTITGAAAIPPVLFPPNHKMVDVTVNYSTSDNCTPPGSIVCVLTVTSNQPPNSHETDIVIIDAHHVQLRAERSGGQMRVYTITITCTDGDGNSRSQDVTVTVP